VGYLAGTSNFPRRGKLNSEKSLALFGIEELEGQKSMPARDFYVPLNTPPLGGYIRAKNYSWVEWGNFYGRRFTISAARPYGVVAGAK
jgi:hypothetical protein